MNIEILFYLFAAMAVFAALRVITARNPLHAVLFLVLAFVSSAGIWMAGAWPSRNVARARTLGARVDRSRSQWPYFTSVGRWEGGKVGRSEESPGALPFPLSHFPTFSLPASRCV